MYHSIGETQMISDSTQYFTLDLETNNLPEPRFSVAYLLHIIQIN